MACSFSKPLPVVPGPNTSNKQSLMQAIAFGLGRSTMPAPTPRGSTMTPSSPGELVP